MFARFLASAWSRLFARPASTGRPPRPAPPPKMLPIRTRQELEIVWLLRFLPSRLQQVLWTDLHTLLRRCPPVENMPTQEYTWPGLPGVTRPRYLSEVLGTKPLEVVDQRLEAELRLSVCVLRAPEALLPRPQRNALLAMEGVRLMQVQKALSRHLSAEGVQALFRQKLGAQG